MVLNTGRQGRCAWVKQNNAGKLQWYLKYISSLQLLVGSNEWSVPSNIKDWLLTIPFWLLSLSTTAYFTCFPHGWPNSRSCPRSHQHWMWSKFCPFVHRSHPRPNQLKWHSSFGSANHRTLKNNLNMDIDVANHSAKLEGCQARAHVYRAEIMYMWLFPGCDMWPNKYCHTCR